MASRQRVFSGSFGSTTSSVPTPAYAALAVKPWSVAVDSVKEIEKVPNPSYGDVYVSDASNHRVEEFGPEGKFILMFGEKVNKTKEGGFPPK